jgi:hypothetical protein
MRYYWVNFGRSIGERPVRVLDCIPLDLQTWLQLWQPHLGHPAQPSPSTSPAGAAQSRYIHIDLNEIPTQCLASPENTTSRGGGRNAREPALGTPFGGWGFNSTSDESWTAQWHDFAGEESSLDGSKSDDGLQDFVGPESEPSQIDMEDFRVRYSDGHWQCSVSTLLGDRASFTGPPPGPTRRITKH